MAAARHAFFTCLCWLSTPRAYDEALGLALAYLEKAVYCGEEKFNAWDVGDSLLFAPLVDSKHLRFVHSVSTQAAAGVGRMIHPSGCFVALRGTLGSRSSFMDSMFWWRDFDRDSCPGCKVDFGFFTSYESVKDQIFEALHEFGCRTQPLYLVGHSLGAAGVSYLLYDAIDSGYAVKHAYALESPRPGNEAFAKALQAKRLNVDAVRVAHYQDLVVHLPPKALFYHHALPEIYYKSRQGIEYEKCGLEDPQCSDQWTDPWHLTADDHAWYLNINPCWCQNDTQMSRQRMSAWHDELPSSCGVAINRMAGNLSCGWHMLQSIADQGLSVRAAMRKIAFAYPRQCGACGPPWFSTTLINLYLVLFAVPGAGLLIWFVCRPRPTSSAGVGGSAYSSLRDGLHAGPAAAE